MKEENLPGLVHWKRGFECRAARLEAIRRDEIRNSDFSKCWSEWDDIFEEAKKDWFHRETYPLSKPMRIFFGVDLPDDTPAKQKTV